MAQSYINDNTRMVVRLAEYCELLSKRIEVLEESIKLMNGGSREHCKVYKMNISHKNKEEHRAA